MIDHMTFRVTDMHITKAFYESALAPLGYLLMFEGSHGDSHIVGFGQSKGAGADGAPIDTWFVDGASPCGGHPVTTGCHLCWTAPDRIAVDAFYKAAMAAGGTDNGPPGLRPRYHAAYYAAFVIDPDGNNIEAVCHRSE